MEGSAATQKVTLSASSSTPAIKLTNTSGSSWLTLPPSGLGQLAFQITADGLLPGNYSALVTASAEGFVSAILNVQLTVLPSDEPSTIRINAGGERFATSDDRVLSGDQYYSGSDRINAISEGEVKYTTEDVLYRSERSAPDFSYNIPVANGDYVIVLHFAELWFGISNGRPAGPGQRLFNVDIEGSRKLENYDIFTKAEGPLTAVEESFEQIITDGLLNINFTSGAANMPTVAAIEVIPKSQYSKTIVSAPIVADAHVLADRSGNYGYSPTLVVKAGQQDVTREAYLRFTISGIKKITSAKLRLYGSNVESDAGINLSAYGLYGNDWRESEINWFKKIPSDPDPIGHTVVNHVAKYYDIDVTDYVKLKSANNFLVSFVLKNPTNKNRKLVFHSKENPSGNDPQLIITSMDKLGSNWRTEVLAEKESSDAEQDSDQSIVYPNPVKKQFILKLSSRHEGKLNLQLVSKSGYATKIQAKNQNTDAAEKEIDLAGLSLNKGFYLLKVTSKTASEVLKVLIAE